LKSKKKNSLFSKFLSKCSKQLKLEEIELLEFKESLVNKKLVFHLLKESFKVNNNHTQGITVFTIANLVWLFSIFLIIVGGILLISMSQFWRNISMAQVEYFSYFLNIFLLLIGSSLNGYLSVMVCLLGCSGFSLNFYLCFFLHPQLSLFHQKHYIILKIYLLMNVCLFTSYTWICSSQLIGVFAVIFIQILLMVLIARNFELVDDDLCIQKKSMEEIPSLTRNMILTTLMFSTMIVIVSYICLVKIKSIQFLFQYGVLLTLIIWDLFMISIHFESNLVGKTESNFLTTEFSFFSSMICQFLIGVIIEGMESFLGLSIIFMMIRLYLHLLGPLVKKNSKRNFTVILFGTGVYLFVSLSILNRFSSSLFNFK
jgi:hypothetical protein